MKKPAQSAQTASVSQLIGQVRQGRANDVPLFDLVRMVEHLVETLGPPPQTKSGKRTGSKSLSEQIHAEFEAIASSISKARQELSEFQPEHVNSRHIPAAGRELQAIVEATETATNMIMESAEKLLELDANDLDTHKSCVTDEAMKIFEACSFQDITGQRVSKIVETLEEIDQRVERITKKLGLAAGTAVVDSPESDRDKRKRELILNGPALNGQGVGQDDIDAMFG